MASRWPISSRCRRIDSSGIRRVFDLAAHLKDPVDLSIGQPYQDVPEPVKASAIRAIQSGKNRYTPTQGHPRLVDAILQRVRRQTTMDGKLIITAGVSGGLFLGFAALVEPGDEVIISDPYFVIYEQAVKFFGGVPVCVDTYPDFRLTAERIEPHITSRTKIIVVGSPANPTGAVATESELRDIARLAERHNLMIFSDEIYGALSFDEPAATFLGLTENLLHLGGYSKSHAATGWRIGYAFGPPDVVDEMAKLQQYTFVCAPSPLQIAVLENLDIDLEPLVAPYRRKRDLICDGLKDRFEFTRPGGAFYLFPKAPWGTGTEFVEEAIRNNLLIIPGNVFSTRNTHFRISYAASDETIQRGIEILNRLATK